jgi:hypothetical protein
LHGVVLWDVSTPSWQARARRIANRELTPLERAQYVAPDAPFLWRN